MRDLSRLGNNGNNIRKRQIRRSRKKQAQKVIPTNNQENSSGCAGCGGVMTDAEIAAGVKRNIKKFGWHLTGGGAGESSPSFTYSTGLTKLGFPEIIIFGLPRETCTHFINLIGNEMRAGKKFELHKPYFGYTVRNYPFVFIEVYQHQINKHMSITKNHYSNFKAWQFVWTDSKGKFPWETGFESKLFKNIQPILGEVPLKP